MQSMQREAKKIPANVTIKEGNLHSLSTKLYKNILDQRA